MSWDSGVIARRGVRVAAAEVDIYIMTLFKAGSETDSAEALSFPPIPLPTGGSKEVTCGEGGGGWGGSLSRPYPGICRDAPGSRLLTGMLEARLCLLDPKGPLLSVFSALAPSFSSPSFFV